MGVLTWIILGAFAGWIASKITGNNQQMGVIANIVVGIIGAFIGGYLFNLVGVTGVTGFNLWSAFVAIIGAIVLLSLISLISRR